MDGTRILIVIVVNIVLATIFYLLHKKFEYKGTRGFLVGLTVILPGLGVLYFIALSIMRMFGQKAIAIQVK